MSRVWLVMGMVLSLAVPVGFLTYSFANPVDRPSQSSPPASQPYNLEPTEDPGADAAASVVRSQLRELRRLNNVENWRSTHSARARRAAAKLRSVARSLVSQPAIRRLAMRGAAFAVALDKYFSTPTQASYERYDASRKALNKAIGAEQ